MFVCSNTSETGTRSSGSVLNLVGLRRERNKTAHFDLPEDRQALLERVPQDFCAAQRVSAPRIKNALTDLL